MSEKEVKPGRPIEYNEKLHPKLAETCFRLGMTNAEACEFMQISTSTLHEWRTKYEEFSIAIKKGKDNVDDQVVATLLKKAMGYEAEEIKIFQHNGEEVIVPYVKKYQPDITSIIFWLKNRRPQEWRDRHDIDLTGDVNVHFDKEDKDL